MKYILTFFFVSLSISLFSQELKLPKKVEAATVHSPLLNIMVDQYEVTVDEWLAYVYHVWKKNDMMSEEQIKKFMPKKKNLPEKYRIIFELFSKQFNIDYMEGYFFNEMYSTISYQNFEMPLPYDWQKDTIESFKKLLAYPMVGMPEQKIEKYIEWREGIFNKDKYVVKKGLRAKARLLSPAEWDTLAMKCGPRTEENLENLTLNPDTINAEGCILMNIKEELPCASTKVGRDIYGQGAYPVFDGFYPDNYGLYNIFGNVAEMTSEKGIAKGGSFKNYGFESFPFESQTYEGPQKWVGFRVYFDFNPEVEEF